VYLVNNNNRKTVIGSAGFSHFWQLLSVSHKIKSNLLAKGSPVPDATITEAVFSNTFSFKIEGVGGPYMHVPSVSINSIFYNHWTNYKINQKYYIYLQRWTTVNLP